MKNNHRFPAAPIAALVFGLALAAPAGAADMTFFITSTGGGKGADFGGLAGADRHCQALAAAAGAGGHTWHAYLSTSAAPGQPAVNARDRIGTGPWQNVKGVVVAKNVAELHGDNNLNKETALTEKGEIVNASGDTPNKHDILTGSQPDGTAFAGSEDKTCGNWTKSGDDGSAIVGHHNRAGTNAPPASMSWNSSHASRGCSDAGLRSTGGAGLIYCFAEK
ncbi:MAG TPA: hypothetical protein VH704_00625 [Casimicrobiaceae bacterium]|jgi:hypothetical protein|nr:hypothetical protein [Casimicrobiaceae bacterium]